MKRYLSMALLFGIAIATLLATPVSADVRLFTLFNNNMILQHGQEVPIWGWAEPGEKVTVTLEGQSFQATAGQVSTLLVKLPQHRTSSRILRWGRNNP